MSGPVYRALAPAKINLGLFLGPVRTADARHELVSVMQSISLCDELTLRAADAPSDQVVCLGARELSGDQNLAARALRLFRERTNWRAGPLQLEIVKRIPVAAGLGGGSADAAAALRLAARAFSAHMGLEVEAELLHELACELGADVPAQVHPGRWLASGAGEQLRALPAPREHFGVLVAASQAALSSGSVYAEADRLIAAGEQRARDAAELALLGERLVGALDAGEPLPTEARLLNNDLQAAALRLCPAIARTLAELQDVGARRALVSGSGPTALGLFATVQLAREAAKTLSERLPALVCAVPVGADFAAVARVDEGQRPVRA